MVNNHQRAAEILFSGGALLQNKNDALLLIFKSNAKVAFSGCRETLQVTGFSDP